MLFRSVRVARRLDEVPLTHASFSRGELSYAKVRALTRVATADNEHELLELARACTASQLERAVRAYRRVSTAEAWEQQEEAHLNVFWNPDGSLEIRASILNYAHGDCPEWHGYLDEGHTWRQV